MSRRLWRYDAYICLCFDCCASTHCLVEQQKSPRWVNSSWVVSLAQSVEMNSEEGKDVDAHERYSVFFSSPLSLNLDMPSVTLRKDEPLTSDCLFIKRLLSIRQTLFDAAPISSRLGNTFGRSDYGEWNRSLMPYLHLRSSQTSPLPRLTRGRCLPHALFGQCLTSSPGLHLLTPSLPESCPG